MSPDLDTRLAQLGALTDGWLRAVVADNLSPGGQRLKSVLEYHLGWRGADLQPLEEAAPAGKKLRPALVLLTCEAVRGEITAAARDAAVAIELVHNFSLVHDDIQDRSELRRHRQTVWSLWGTPQGINAGDALFALAQLAIVRGRDALAAQMAAELNATALKLCEGQFLDVDLQLGDVPAGLDVYETMITRKTGVLFAAACRLGALAGGASAEVCDAFASYGLALGIGFQEQDDLLGVWGRSAETGKPDAADIVERKRGLPAAIALSEPNVPGWLSAAYGPSEGRMPDELVGRIVRHFEQLGVRAAIEHRVEGRFKEALSCLRVAGAREPARGYLTAICGALVSRRT